MKKMVSIIIPAIVSISITFGQMHTLYGITLTITPEDTKSLTVSFKLVESDILSKEYIGINHDDVTLHLSYTNTNTESMISNNYHLTMISRIYDESSYDEWSKKVYLFQTFLGLEPNISAVDGLPLRIATWRFTQTNTIFNVMYNESKRRTVEMLSYDLLALR